MSKGLKSWKYLCENHYVDIPIPKGNETDKDLDDYAIGCGINVEKSLKALEIIKKHKLLNYIFKNEKCANMYHLSKEEIELLKEALL